MAWSPGESARSGEEGFVSKRNFAAAWLIFSTIAVLVLAAPASSASAADPTNGPTIIRSIKNDVSRPLIEQGDQQGQNNGDHQDREIPHRAIPDNDSANSSRVSQPAAPAVVSATAPTLVNSFEGIGNGFVGPAGTFSVNSAPPDTNGAVGPTHYVETVNSSFAIFDKTGTPIYGPKPINSIWSTFGGGCQSNNDGDPSAVYDGLADRWIITQFSVTTTPYLMCVAVSTTSDPTGSYYRYSFSYGNSNFPDYPKLSVWPDAYYLTVNFFTNGTTFAGAGVAALDRAKMLAGQPATQQLFQTSTLYGGLLAATVDGSRLPPAGAPNYLVALGTSTSLRYWKFHVDWTTPSSSTFTGPTSLAVAGYTRACNGGTCIPQSGTTQQLDSLADRVMYRLAYRNFADHEALVVNHSVAAGSSTGVRWYELRPVNGNLTVFQQGTYAPDSSYRWMGSIAMDQAGGIGLGYSVSSSSLHPAIRYTGRLASDPLGQMGQGEGSIVEGVGSQGVNRALSRWGDYSSMSVDPADGCTFWYANEYIPTTGTFNWRTRIGTFRLPNCGVPNDFSISANPTSLSLVQGQSGTSTISTAVTSGSAQTVSLSASGFPAGATASFNPTSVTAGGNSTLTLSAGSAAAGTYTVTVTGTGTSANHSTTVSLTVNAPPPPNDFSISANPTSLSLVQGQSGTSAISTVLTSGSAETVNLTATGTPAGATASLSPTSVTTGGGSTLTVGAGTATPGTYTLTVTGTASATHSTTVSLTITAPPPSGITNGNFEDSAAFAGWTRVGSTAISSTAHGGVASAMVGSGSAFNGDSSVAQTFTAPSAGGTLSFWYRVVCTDTVTYDWATATLRDNTAGTTATMLAKTCSNTGSWNSASAALTASHSYTLTLIDHDDNYASDPTYTLYDDVGIGAAPPPPPPPPPSVIANGDFETGSLSGWTSAGSTATSTIPHAGSYSARVGSSSPFNGDSSVAQTFVAPSTGGTLTFWYRVVCTDTVTYDWATATLRDNTAGTTTTVLAKTCTNTGSWSSKSATLVGSHSYTLTLIDHDDNYATDPTYTLYDDVTLQ